MENKIYSKQEQSASFYIYSFGIIVMSALNSYVIVRFIVPITLIFVIISSFFLKDDEIISAAIVSYQLSLWVQHIYIIIIFFIVYVLRKRGKLKLPTVFFLYLFYIALSLFSITNPYFDMTYYCNTIIYRLIFCILLLQATQDSENLTKIGMSFIIGYCGKAIITLLIAVKYVDIDFLLSSSRLGFTNLSFYLPENLEIPNENALGIGAVLTISILYVISIQKEKSKKTNIISALIYAFCFIVGLITKSRSFFFAFAVCVLIILMYRFSTGRGWLKTVSVILIGALVVIQLFPELLSSFSARFQVTDITNGRSMIFTTINNLFFNLGIDKILFGIGLIKDYEAYLGISFAFHNFFQQLYVTSGIIGAVVLVLFMISLIRVQTVMKNFRSSIISFMPIIIACCGGLTSQSDFFVFLICILLIGVNNREAKEYYD